MRNRIQRRKRGGTRLNLNYNALFALLVVVAVVVLICVSSVGDFLSEKVFAPIFTALKTEKPKGTPNPSSTQSGAVIDMGGNSEAKVTLKAISCFSLQMGVYSSEDKASVAAGALRTQGAAGYVFLDNGKYRVLAAGYSDEANAKSVKSRLLEDGKDCKIFNFNADEAVFLVTSTNENIKEIETIFETLYTVLDETEKAALSFDKDKKTVDEGKISVSDILAKVKKVSDSLTIPTENETVKRIVDCLNSFSDKLTVLKSSNASDTVDFAAELKYLSLELANLYVALADSLGVG
ncbi:MAG: SPOR domain-containing protein [Clostridia bacterium]